MQTRRNLVTVTGSLLVMFAYSGSAYGQSLQGNLSLPVRLGDITQPEAVPITLTPHHHALPIRLAEEEDGGIIWGPGREIQAGLRARLWVQGDPAGRFIFDVYIRNKTDRTLTVECPSYAGLSVPTGAASIGEVHSDRIYCSPIMQDEQGKLVDIGVRHGTDEHRYTLAPGQMALISHWMLRTENHEAQNTNRRVVTQVAYVSPGAYLMSCDVRAKWDGQYSDLRTGKAPFDVLKADVEEAGPKVRSR